MCCKRRGKLTELITFTAKYLINMAKFCYSQRTLSLKGESSFYSPSPTHKALYTYIDLYIHKYIRRSQTQKQCCRTAHQRMEKFTAMWLKVTCPFKIMPGNKKDISNKPSSPTSVKVDISVQNLIRKQGQYITYLLKYIENTTCICSLEIFCSLAQSLEMSISRAQSQKTQEQSLLIFSWDQIPHGGEARVGQDLPFCIHSHTPTSFSL